MGGYARADGGGNTVLEPHAGLHWAWLHGQGFAESGGRGQNRTVGADPVHSAQPYLGLTLMHAGRKKSHFPYRR